MEFRARAGMLERSIVCSYRAFSCDVMAILVYLKNEKSAILVYLNNAGNVGHIGVPNQSSGS